MDTFKMPAEKSTAELVIKKSRFIATVVPIESEAEAVRFFAAVKKQYRDAKHNVTAFKLQKGGLARYSDDGEPHSTAGLPVFQAIEHHGLTNCAVVVTRYFGGVLLGTGGLVRAYFDTASAAIAAGRILTMKAATVLCGSCSYADYAILAPLLQNEKQTLRVLESTFSDQVFLKLALSCEALAPFLQRVNDTFCSRLQFTEQEQLFLGF